MKLEFDLHQDDLRNYYAFHYWYSSDRKSFRIKRRLLMAIVTASIPILFLLIRKEPNTPRLVILETSWAVVCFVFGLFWAKYSLLRRLDKNLIKTIQDGKNKDLLGHQVMEFDDEKIVCRTAFSESTFSTKVIEKFRTDANSFYIYISSMQAFVIPRRELNEREQRDLLKWVTDLRL